MTTHAARAKLFYGSASKEVDGGTMSLSLSNYYGRLEATVRDDPMRLAQVRAEQSQLGQFFDARKVSPSAAQEILSVLHEHESVHRIRQHDGKEPDSKAALDLMFKTLQREEGSHEAVAALVARAQKGAEVINQTIPSLAERAVSSGAVNDPRVMRFLADVAAEPTQVQK